MTNLVQNHVIINGNRIAYGIYGQGEPVVLIHGTPFFSHIWRNLAPAIVEAGYQVHVYDLLGFGHSERPQDPATDTSVSGQLPILLGLLDHWGLEAPHIVGHDIGGAVGKQLGIYHPDRIRSLTLIDCVSFDSWPSPRTRQQMREGLENLITASDEKHRAHFREWILSAAHDKANLQNDALETYLAMISGPVGQTSLFQHQIMHYDPEHTDKLTDHLHELGQLPVQLIWGADDIWQVTDWAHRLHESIPGSTLHILENCGHLVMEDQPARVRELILGHLRENSDESSLEAIAG